MLKSSSNHLSGRCSGNRLDCNMWMSCWQGEASLCYFFPARFVQETQASKTGCSLTELGGLKLEGELFLKILQNVRNVEEAEGADVKLAVEHGEQKIQLAEDVFQSPQPSKSLTSLTMEKYFGRTFPFWVMELSLPNLVLELESCNCEKLPALGRLPQLKVLPLNLLPLIRHLGSDFYGGANAFPSLEELYLCYLEGLEEWSSAGGGEKLFPCLRKLTSIHSPKLKALPSDFSSVKIRIKNCDELKSFRAVNTLDSMAEGSDSEW